MYGKRNTATHGRRFTWSKGLEKIPNNVVEDMDSLVNSYKLLCDLFYTIVDRGNRFSDDDVERHTKLYPGMRITGDDI